MWISNRHLKLIMSQMEPLIFLQTCSTHSYPVSMDKGWQIPSFLVVKAQHLGVNLLFLSCPTWSQSVRKSFSLHFQNTSRIQFLVTFIASTLLRATIICHLNGCKSHLTALPTLLLTVLYKLFSTEWPE